MRHRMTIISTVCTLALATSLASAQSKFAIRAKGYINSEGAIVENAVLLIENGKLAEVGEDVSLSSGIFVLDRSDSIVGPGLVDPHVTVGAMGRTGENGASILPNMSATELMNGWHADYERAVRAGVTTVVLAPGETHLVGGVTAVAKTAGDPAGRLIGDGPLKISLTRNAFNLFRTPTSLQGGLAELRNMIAAAKAKDSDDSAFAKWARGEAPALVEVDDDAALTSLALFAKEQGVRCIALHANLAAERLDAVQMLDLPVILGTYEFSDPRRYTRAPGMLGKAGVPVALTSNAPRYAPEWLRYGAAIELRQGASRELVQRSISTTAAEIAGVANRVGSIAKGMDADLVIYSGDPLDLRSRILEVFVNGERVFVADEPPAMPEDDDA